MIISTSPSGAVIVHPAGAPEAPREGWTIREIESLPEGPGELRWQDDQLVRVEDQSQRVARVKAEAGRRILAMCPQWKQANLTARMVELMPGRIAGTLTQGEQSEIAGAEAIWAHIKAIRAHSNTLETDPGAGPWPE